MVRALVAGIGDFPEQFPSEDEQAEGRAVFAPLPTVHEAVWEVVYALDKVDVATGAPLLEPDRGGLLAAWRGLCEQSPDDEPLIVHFAGHGARSTRTGALYLATHGGDPADNRLAASCVRFADLLEEAENSDRPVLFLLDVCGAGQAVMHQQLQELLLARRAQDASRNAWVIGACSADRATYRARFSTATAAVLRTLADGVLDVSPALEFVPVGTLAEAIDGELARADRAAGRPGQSLVRTPHTQAVLEPQPFLRNPAYTNDPRIRALSGMDRRLREFALSCDPGLDPLHFATRAAGNPNADVCQFSGRRSQLSRIQKWIKDADGTQGRLMVVTGGPGSGKSALLGVTVCLTHPGLDVLRQRVRTAVRTFRPAPRGRVVAVHARQLTVQQITDSLLSQLHDVPATATAPGHRAAQAAGAGRSGSGVSELVRRLGDAEEVLVVLDALDEAADPAAVLHDLILPLTGVGGGDPVPGCRVLLGTRPWWDTLPVLFQHLAAHPEALLDLDPRTEADRSILADDLHDYLDQLLDNRRPQNVVRHIAERLAQYTDGGAFLVAALYADHLLSGTKRIADDPPCDITQVYDLHRDSLTRAEPWIGPVLAVLGQARGQGMPLDLIHAAALAHAPHFAQRNLPPRLEDTRRALTKAAFYLRTTPDIDQRLLYRYFHQALTDHTLGTTDPATIHHALINSIPPSADGTPDWARARPYLTRHAADHAAATGSSQVFDRLLGDARFLLHADPDQLVPHLRLATGEQAVLNAHIYRTSTAAHPERHRVAVRRDLLALDAAAWHQPALARSLAALPLDGRPSLATPRWATNRTAHPARLHTLTGHTDWVRAVAAVTPPGGTPLAVTAGQDRNAIVWDLTTGRRLHTLTGHTGDVRAVAVLTLPGGTSVAVTGGQDRTAIVWDLTTGRQLRTLTGHTGGILTVAAVTPPGGTPLAVTGGQDRSAIVWDLTTGRRLHTLTGHTGDVRAVAVHALPGRTPLAVTGGQDRSAIVWDLTTGRQLHTLTGHSEVHAVTTLTLPDGTPAAIISGIPIPLRTTGYPARASGHEHNSMVWDLATGRRLHTLAGHIGEVHAVAAHTLRDGTPVAVTASHDRKAMVWNLTTGRRLHTLTGHSGWIRAVTALTLPDGTPAAVTTSHDRTAMVWDLRSGRRLHTLTGHTGGVNAVTAVTLPDGTPAAVTAGQDRTAIVWDLTTGRRTLTVTGHRDHIRAVSTLALPDRTRAAVTAGNDGIAIVWDLATGRRLHTLSGHTGGVSAVTAVTLPDGTPAAVTAGHDRKAMVWDLTTGHRLHTLTGHTSALGALTTLTPPTAPPPPSPQAGTTQPSSGTSPPAGLDTSSKVTATGSSLSPRSPSPTAPLSP
ncbi:AAA family ATPase [Peterkaempfera sp. SMS 1(5)a]|uniref:AAA family ATPase n=1 Tax=Peterkaempfera podocarpi TaxID=3232308 RepID=UPI0036732562